jgi:hypothetical protein
VIKGSNLGGVDDTNDCTLTVTGAAGAAALSAANVVATGTPVALQRFAGLQGDVGSTVETSDAGANTAIFTIHNTGTGAYTFDVTTAGSGYDSHTATGDGVADKIVIKGSNLGGVDGTNDCTLTVTGAAGAAALSAANVVATGTPVALSATMLNWASRIKWQVMIGGGGEEKEHQIVLSPDRTSLYIFGTTTSMGTGLNGLQCIEHSSTTCRTDDGTGLFIAKLVSATGELSWIKRFGTFHKDASEYPTTLIMLPHPATNGYSIVALWSSTIKDADTEATWPCLGEIDRDGNDADSYTWDSVNYRNENYAYQGSCSTGGSYDAFVAIVKPSDGTMRENELRFAANGVPRDPTTTHPELFGVRVGGKSHDMVSAAALQPIATGSTASDRTLLLVGQTDGQLTSARDRKTHQRYIGECVQGDCGGRDAIAIAIKLKWKTAYFAMEFDTAIRWGSDQTDVVTSGEGPASPTFTFAMLYSPLHTVALLTFLTLLPLLRTLCSELGKRYTLPRLGLYFRNHGPL